MSHGVKQLKELLFDKEREELIALQERLNTIAADEQQARLELQARVDELKEIAEQRKTRLDEVYEQAGSRERLRSSVAEVIDGVLLDVDSDKDKSAELRKAMLPFVTSTVTREITNNRDTLVQVLSPSIGVMIRDYITSAMNDLMAQINRKLEKAIPGRGRKMRAKAKAAGMSMAEIALAETQKLTVVELYLVRRGSGQVIDHWASDASELLAKNDGAASNPSGGGTAIGSNRDALVGGFLTAITDFAKEAFEADKSSLRSLQMDGFHIYLRSSPAYLLAAKCAGARLPGIEKAIDDEFLQIISKHDRLLSQVTAGEGATAHANGSVNMTGNGQRQAAAGAGTGASGAFVEHGHGESEIKQVLPALAKSLEARVAKRHAELFAEDSAGASPLKVIAWIVGLPLLLLAGWLFWQNYWTTWTKDTAHRTLSAISQMKGYPVKIAVEPGGGAVRLSGLTPSTVVRRKVLNALERAMPGVTIHDELTTLPTSKAIDPEPQIAEVRRDISKLKDSSNRKLVTLEERNKEKLAELAARSDSRASELARLAAQNRKRLAELARRNQQKLALLAAQNKQRIAELERQGQQGLVQLEAQIVRASVKRALDRAGKRLGVVLSGLVSLAKDLRARRGTASADPQVMAKLERANAMARGLAKEISARKKALAAGADLKRNAAQSINRLTQKVASLNLLLNELGRLPAVGGGGKSAASLTRRTLPNGSVESAEELSLAVERLSISAVNVARALELKPVEKTVQALSGTIDKLNARLAELTPGPRQRLLDWIHNNAIFFAGETVYRHGGRARSKLKKLAELQRDAGVLIRVIGYTDRIGQPAKNAELARRRAQKVADELRALGVPAKKIIVVGRGAGSELNAGAGRGSFNRRVEFEIGFEDEQASGR